MKICVEFIFQNVGRRWWRGKTFFFRSDRMKKKTLWEIPVRWIFKHSFSPSFTLAWFVDAAKKEEDKSLPIHLVVFIATNSARSSGTLEKCFMGADKCELSAMTTIKISFDCWKLNRRQKTSKSISEAERFQWRKFKFFCQCIYFCYFETLRNNRNQFWSTDSRFRSSTFVHDKNQHKNSIRRRFY